jgi:hypothetical protein
MATQPGYVDIGGLKYKLIDNGDDTVSIAISGGQQLARKTVAFTGAAGLGAAGTVALFTQTGQVLVDLFAVYCSESLVGAATLEFGTAADTDRFIAQVAATTTVDAGDWIDDGAGATPAGATQYTSAYYAIDEDIIATVGAADITDGTISIFVLWRPLSAGATLVAA